MENCITKSDNLGHNNNSIYFYTKQIIADLQWKGVATKHIHYCSDGPSSQFKNNFNATNLKFDLNNYEISTERNFSLHGKRENDASDGDVKNGVWHKVLQKMLVDANLDDFAMIAHAKFIKFNIFSFNRRRSDKFRRFSKWTLFIC